MAPVSIGNAGRVLYPPDPPHDGLAGDRENRWLRPRSSSKPPPTAAEGAFDHDHDDEPGGDERETATRTLGHDHAGLYDDGHIDDDDGCDEAGPRHRDASHHDHEPDECERDPSTLFRASTTSIAIERNRPHSPLFRAAAAPSSHLSQQPRSSSFSDGAGDLGRGGVSLDGTIDLEELPQSVITSPSYLPYSFASTVGAGDGGSTSSTTEVCVQAAAAAHHHRVECPYHADGPAGPAGDASSADDSSDRNTHTLFSYEAILSRRAERRASSTATDDTTLPDAHMHPPQQQPARGLPPPPSPSRARPKFAKPRSEEDGGDDLPVRGDDLYQTTAPRDVGGGAERAGDFGGAPCESEEPSGAWSGGRSAVRTVTIAIAGDAAEPGSGAGDSGDARRGDAGGWVELLTDDGVPYYHHAASGVSQWHAPSPSTSTTLSPSEPAAAAPRAAAYQSPRADDGGAAGYDDGYAGEDDGAERAYEYGVYDTDAAAAAGMMRMTTAHGGPTDHRNDDGYDEHGHGEGQADDEDAAVAGGGGGCWVEGRWVQGWVGGGWPGWVELLTDQVQQNTTTRGGFHDLNGFRALRFVSIDEPSTRTLRRWLVPRRAGMDATQRSHTAFAMACVDG